MVSAAIAAYRDAPKDQLLSLVTCGFELENMALFHPLIGEGRTAIRNGDVLSVGGEFIDELRFVKWLDEKTVHEHFSWSMLAASCGLWPAGHPFRHLNSRDKWASLFAAFDIDSHQNIERFALTGLVTPDQLRDHSAAIRTRLDTQENRQVFKQKPKALEWLQANLGIPNLSVGTDASVKGFEIRTEGGRTADEFKAAAVALMDYDIKHEITTVCSFHIHIKVKDVTHAWSERIQMAITEYLLNAHVPGCVSARWSCIDKKPGEYFQPGVRDQKHSFVHKHPAHGTWEFRCFGNISSSEDAMHCLQLACEALQYAYQVLAGKHVLIADAHHWSQETWQDACKAAMRMGTRLECTEYNTSNSESA